MKKKLNITKLEIKRGNYLIFVPEEKKKLFYEFFIFQKHENHAKKKRKKMPQKFLMSAVKIKI